MTCKTIWQSIILFFILSSSAIASANQAPDCSTAYADPNSLWPPNHSLHAISIDGVTDAEGDVPVINVQCIYQDELLDSEGDGNTEPDAAGINSDTPQVRRERQGSGNGRVYHIFFKATDTLGASCFGEVTASVNQSKKNAAVDDGALHESVSSSLPCTASLNSAPVVNDINSTTVEDGSLDILLTGTDAENDTLSYSLNALPQHGSVNINNDTATYTPTANFNGSDSFTYQANDSQLDSNVATVTINVTAVNDAPVANAQSVYTNEDTDVAIVLTGSDSENSALTYQLQTLPQNGIVTGTLPNVTYTPNGNYSGSDSFTFNVNDGVITSNTATVDITVGAINDAPTADDQSVTSTEDTTVNILLSGIDTESNTLSFQVITPPSNGTLSGTPPNVTYTPNQNFNGSDSFTFLVNDGALDSNIATIAITVTAVNDAPSADNQTLSTTEDSNLNIVLSGSDIENDALSFQIQTQPQHGTLSGTLPNVSYTPNQNFHGNDSFSFMANDGVLDSIPATIDITVTPINDAPIANSQSLSTAEDSDLNIVLTGSDVEGSSLTFEIQTQPSSGTLTGTLQDFIYTPNENFNGNDSFTFIVNDGELNSNNATIDITVNSVNDAPTANGQSVSLAEDTGIALTLTGSDPENDPLTFQIQSQPSFGIISGVLPTITYTPAVDFFWHG